MKTKRSTENDNTRTLIIAEVGVNHNGSLEMARELIKTASEIGADVVKFQFYKTENMTTKSAPKAKYQLLNTNASETQFNMLKKYELSKDDIFELKSISEDLKLEFLCTAFDIESLKYLTEIGQKRIKVPSGEITNLPLLRHIARCNKEIILSTGMSTLIEIEQAISILENNGSSRNQITILHCTSNYPANFDEVNLNAIKKIREEFRMNVGYSDHSNGIEVSIAAVAIGATIIEKHITLNRSLEGPDHKASLEPSEFQQLVRSIRNIEQALGDGIKKPTESETRNQIIARKSIVASKRIGYGELLTPLNITVKRPGNGLSPLLWDAVIGSRAKRTFLEDEQIEI